MRHDLRSHSSSDDEKQDTSTKTAFVLDDEIPDPDAGLSDEERARIDKALLRKLDFKLIPWLTLLYLVSFLDRTNIGNAKLDGLLTDNHLTNGQYNAALSTFFVSYAVFEPLTNVLLKRYQPKIFLTVTITLWGIVMVTMGLVHNFAGLTTARFFLGLTEAGLFPGVNYYLSCWYKRDEFGKRAAIFFSAAAVAGSFGGLLAAAIGKMRGVGGKGGWAWIFILEGLLTVLIGLVSYWMVHDFPDTATFLSEQDRARVLRRLRLDNQASAVHEDFNMKYFWLGVKDWKTPLYMAIYMGVAMPLYSFSLFLPTIIQQLGYTSVKANLLSVPPYAVAAAMTIAVGFAADKTRTRGIYNIGFSVIAMAGFAMLLGSQNPHIKYAGVFLGAIGIYPCISNTIAWGSNNFEGVYKRGVSMGFLIGWGNLSGIISSNIYQASTKPKFYPGHSIVLAFLVIFLFGGSVLMTLMLRRENRLKVAGRRDYRVEGKTPEQVRVIGDAAPSFMYVL